MKHKNISIFIPNAGCKQCCLFCNQSDISGSLKVPTPDEVNLELTKALQFLPTIEERKATEIAFFGGSFTALDIHLQERYLEVAARFVSEYGLSGIRISTRPDAIDDAILCMLKMYKVTAIELGAQSMDDTVLSANQRGHTSKAVSNAAKLIQSYDISLGLQMMVGLYKSNVELELLTLERLISLNPDTLRIYPTVVIDGTGLADLMKSGLYKPMELNEAVSLCGKLLLRCHEKRIKVIKLGLHSSEQMSQKAIGGAYHPALRELCEGELYLSQAIKALKSYKKGNYEILVEPSCLSKMIGQAKRNILHLKEQGYTVRVLPLTGIGIYEVAIREVMTCS